MTGRTWCGPSPMQRERRSTAGAAALRRAGIPCAPPRIRPPVRQHIPFLPGVPRVGPDRHDRHLAARMLHPYAFPYLPIRQSDGSGAGGVRFHRPARVAILVVIDVGEGRHDRRLELAAPRAPAGRGRPRRRQRKQARQERFPGGVAPERIRSGCRFTGAGGHGSDALGSGTRAAVAGRSAACRPRPERGIAVREAHEAHPPARLDPSLRYSRACACTASLQMLEHRPRLPDRLLLRAGTARTADGRVLRPAPSIGHTL